MFMFYAHFFFSSRRRHTRWPRDWSSDVCFPIFLSPPVQHDRVDTQRHCDINSLNAFLLGHLDRMNLVRQRIAVVMLLSCYSDIITTWVDSSLLSVKVLQVHGAEGGM